ncbi:extracellular solute-binding protein [Streptomyces sp. 110]|uniref:Extracellular solute-binding protein n=1 Tax=Streptomyces endocoffeicus TaxID=2898945 RepID=A0ABS1Q712_9ACTN|nr:extracellular solute-binding protein [Streptomyces endocoffeicus]MBL1120165.1 extracellular solute-binding protein [Streptomyces endocoffeicus]
MSPSSIVRTPMNRRGFVSLAGSAAAGVALTACGSSGSGSAKTVTIEYWHQFSAAYGGAAMEKLIAKFNKQNPGIHVVSSYKDAATQPLQLLQPTFIGGATPPDVGAIYFGSELLGFMANKFPYTSVDQLADKFSGKDFLAKMPTNMLQAAKVGSTQVGLPLYAAVLMGIYNVDVVRGAGVDPASLTTWDQWRAAARTIRRRTGAPPLWIHLDSTDNWGSQTLVESNGGRFVECGPDGAKAAIAGPAGVEAIEMWTGLVRDGLASPSRSAAAQQAFMAGRLPVVFTTPGLYGTFKSQAKFEIAGTPAPSFGSKPQRLPIGGKLMVCFARDERKQEASWRLMQFLASPESQAALDKATGYLPVRQDVPSPADAFGRLGVKQAAFAVPRQGFPGPQGPQAAQALFDGMVTLLNSRTEVKPALAGIAAKVDGLVKGQPCR